MANKDPMKPVTQTDLDRFHDAAPRVLESRSRAYFVSELDFSFNLILAGAIPIIGVACFGWAASNWLVWLVCGCWMGFVCDCLRRHFLKKQIQSYCERIVDDTYVSVIGEAIRRKKDMVAECHIPKIPDYGVAVFMDLVFCSVSSFVILASIPENLSETVITRPWFVPSLVAFLAYRILMTVWEIADVRTDRRSKPVVKLAFGLRGACMFVVMFIVLLVLDGAKDNAVAGRTVVYIVNGILVLVGIVSFCGIFLMMSETRWLRKYLKERDSS